VARYAGESRSRRAGGTLAAFFLGSVAVHAAVLVVLPGFERERGLPSVAVLDVVLLTAEPVVAAANITATGPVLRQPQPGRVPARDARESENEPSLPVVALSDPRGTAGASFSVEPAGTPEAPSAVPAQISPEPGLAPTAPGSNAAYLRNPAPSYPLASRRAGEQGTVTLRVRVGRDGFASSVTVEQSSGSPHLDVAALEAVKAWRFTPARRGAEAVESWMLVPIVFRLESSS
jgi:protein TonB